MDYQKELDLYKDSLTEEEKSELTKLSGMQKDVAVGESAEDFIRHPFFVSFQNEMNRMIADSNVSIATILAKNTSPEMKIAEMQAHQAGIEKIKDLKRWLNKHVIAGRVGRHAIKVYEEETDQLNAKVQTAVDEAKLKQ